MECTVCGLASANELGGPFFHAIAVLVHENGFFISWFLRCMQKSAVVVCKKALRYVA